MIRSNSSNWLSRNWFLPVAVIVVIGDFGSVYLIGWSNAQLFEAALLIDFVLVIPLLYWWCYWSKGKMAVVESIALACFGIWITGKIVPTEHHNLLDSITWLRYVGLAGLLALEVKLVVTVYKAVIFSGKSKEEIQRKFESEGLPLWLAKFMAFEASLFHKAWLFVKRAFDRKP